MTPGLQPPTLRFLSEWWAEAEGGAGRGGGYSDEEGGGRECGLLLLILKVHITPRGRLRNFL